MSFSARIMAFSTILKSFGNFPNFAKSPSHGMKAMTLSPAWPNSPLPTLIAALAASHAGVGSKMPPTSSVSAPPTAS
jgi:hypothetical protein